MCAHLRMAFLNKAAIPTITEIFAHAVISYLTYPALLGLEQVFEKMNYEQELVEDETVPPLVTLRQLIGPASI